MSEHFCWALSQTAVRGAARLAEQLKYPIGASIWDFLYVQSYGRFHGLGLACSHSYARECGGQTKPAFLVFLYHSFLLVAFSLLCKKAAYPRMVPTIRGNVCSLNGEMPKIQYTQSWMGMIRQNSARLQIADKSYAAESLFMKFCFVGHLNSFLWVETT